MAIPAPTLPNYTIPQQAPPNLLGLAQQAGTLREMNMQQNAQSQLLPLQIQEQQEKTKQAALTTQQQQMQLASQQALMKAIASGDLNKFASSGGTPDTPSFDAAGAYQHLIQNGVLPEHAGQLVNQFQTVEKNGAEIYKNLAEADKTKYQTHLDTHKEVVDDFANVKDQAGLAAAIQSAIKIPALEPEVKQAISQLQLADVPAFVQKMNIANELAINAQKQAEAKKAQQGVIPEGGGLSPEGQQKIQQDIAVATNPQIQAGKEAVAAAEGQARANVEAAMARGSNAALSNVPPHLVTPASEAANKAGTEYAQSLSVTDRLKAMMDDAKKGNVVAYQLIPQEGALQVTTSQGVHRINMTEIQNYGGGSLWQRMQGHIGKTLTGKSIPDSVLDDMSEMQDIMARGNRAKYENTLDTINQTFGAKFKPVEMKDIQPTKAEAKYPSGVTLPSGWTWTTHADGRIGITDGKNFKPYNGK